MAKTINLNMDTGSGSSEGLKNTVVSLGSAIENVLTQTKGVQGAANQAASAAGKVARSVSNVVAELAVASSAGKEYAQDLTNATQVQTTMIRTTKKLKRTLAEFDELNRLNGPEESTVTKTVSKSVIVADEVEDTATPGLQEIMKKVMALLEPLKKIDFSGAVAAFGKLKEALAPFGHTLFSGLSWAWNNLFVPLAAWTIENILPWFLELLAAGLHVLNEAIIALKPFAIWLWENFLKPLAQWAGGKIVEIIGGFVGKLVDLGLWIAENREKVEALINLVESLAAGWKLVGDMIDRLRQVWSVVKSTWNTAASWFQQTVLNPIQNGFKKVANGMIGLLNGVITGTGKAINGIIRALNTLKFDLPSWIPQIGGKSFGFNLKTVSVQQIPYLAKGAVLPANKPFMAVVGDQRHGTNIEAPLATIQEAVALVMGEQTSALVAGFEASIGVQREILQAVLGISIGDDVIGQAVSRYNRKMAVVRGG